MPLQGRHILRETYLDALDTYALIESYPQENYLPSYLVLAHDGTRRSMSCLPPTSRKSMCV